MPLFIGNILLDSSDSYLIDVPLRLASRAHSKREGPRLFDDYTHECTHSSYSTGYLFMKVIFVKSKHFLEPHFQDVK